MKFKLSRKRKKQYQKDLAIAFYKHWYKMLGESIENGEYLKAVGCGLLVSANFRRLMKTEYSYRNNVYEWEWLYFRRRVEVNSMFTILGCPDNGEIDKESGKWIRYDKPKENYVDDDILLEWYHKYYPDDKLSHHFCKQNRNKWNKFKN